MPTFNSGRLYDPFLTKTLRRKRGRVLKKYKKVEVFVCNECLDNEVAILFQRRNVQPIEYWVTCKMLRLRTRWRYIQNSIQEFLKKFTIRKQTQK